MRNISLLSLTFALALSLTAATTSAADTVAPAQPPLAVNDISWLLPMPKTKADLATAISLQDVIGPTEPGGPGPTPAWADSAMAQYFDRIDSFGAVAGTSFRIQLTERVRKRAVWHIAGVRLDPGAPGLDEKIVAQFGRQPQLRLIVQPIVDDGNGGIQVLDIAAHLIFSFTTGREDASEPGCFDRPIADMAKVKALAEDARSLRDKLAAGGVGGEAILTSGKLLGIHPAFASASAAASFREEIRSFLNKHLPTARLTSMAIAGLPDDFGEPWMFLAMAENPKQAGQFFPAPSPALGREQFVPPEKKFAIMLSFVTDVNVQPPPAPNNLMPVTCKHSALPVPILTDRKGLATAEIFAGGVSKERIKDIVDLVGDPAKSHFFNTDCVSCHTDTHLAIEHLKITSMDGIETAVLPKSQWNVRNFGWFPDEGPTATNRTLQETRESLAEFNRLLAEPE